MEKRVISTRVQEEDIKIESSLRPQKLEDYVGQEKIKENIEDRRVSDEKTRLLIMGCLFYGCSPSFCAEK